MSRKEEAHSTHCVYCFREFEAPTVEEAVRKTEEHEKTCDMREPIFIPQQQTG